MFSSVPQQRAWSKRAIERTTAVGPFLSIPCTGEMPSDSGVPAKLPSGVAPVKEPNQTWVVVGIMLAA